MSISDQYQPPKAPLTEGESRKFGWGSAALGGAVAVAAMAIGGTLITNAYMWFLLRQGFSREQAYSYLAQDWLSLPAVLSFILLVVAGIVGGYLSARQGKGTPWLQG